MASAPALDPSVDAFFKANPAGVAAPAAAEPAVVGAPPVPAPGEPSPSGKEQGRVGDEAPATIDPSVDQFFQSNPAGVSEPATTPAEAKDLGAGHAYAHHVFADLPLVGSSLNWAAQNVLAHVAAGIRGTNFDDELAQVKAFDEGSDVAHPVAAEAGGVTAKVLGYTAAGVAAPSAFAGRGLIGVGKSAVTSGLLEGLDALTQGKDPEEALKAAGWGAAGGAGGTIVGKALGWTFSHFIKPEIQRLSYLAQDKFGIILSPDVTSNNPILKLIKKAPGYGGREGPGMEASRGQWRRAVTREMGATNGSDNFLPQTMNDARINLHNDFQNFAGQAQDLPMTSQFQRIMRDIHDDVTTPGGMSPVWKKGEKQKALDLLGYIAAPFRQGNVRGPWRISPQQYLDMTEQAGALSHWIGTPAGRANPNIEAIAAKLKNGLDDILEQNLPQNAVEGLTRARRQWWALKTIEPLAEKYRTKGGIIPPEELANAVAANTKNFAYGGGGALGELADIGGMFLKHAPDHKVDFGTFVKWIISAGSGAGLGFGILHANPWGAAAGIALPAAARIAGAAARSPGLLPAAGRGIVRGGSVGFAPYAPAAVGAANQLTQPEAPAP